jgi:hypothetical protein
VRVNESVFSVSPLLSDLAAEGTPTSDRQPMNSLITLVKPAAQEPRPLTQKADHQALNATTRGAEAVSRRAALWGYKGVVSSALKG